MKRTSALKLTLPQDAPSDLVPQQITTGAPISYWGIITPDIARQWLAECNKGNRHVREDHVLRLACDMLEDKWVGRNGEAIRFDTEGRLVDGQHRLLACIQAEKEFESLVVYGVDKDAYATIGIGVKKSLADFLGPLDGEKNTALLSSTVRLVYAWKSGLLGKSNKDGQSFPSIAKLRETLASNPKIRESVNHTACKFNGLRRLLPPTYVALLHYAACQQDREYLADSMLDRLQTGLGLSQTDPVYHLRRFLLAQQSPRPGHRRAAKEYTLALLIKTWNAVKAEKPMGALTLRMDEKFPEL